MDLVYLHSISIIIRNCTLIYNALCPLFSRDNSASRLFSCGVCEWARDSCIGVAIMHPVSWCDHGGPLSHMFHSLVRKQNVNLGRPRVWKEIAKS